MLVNPFKSLMSSPSNCVVEDGIAKRRTESKDLTYGGGMSQTLRTSPDLWVLCGKGVEAGNRGRGAVG
jgi:hypothetical protein